MADWEDLFHKGESPYFAMFTCGCRGIPLEDVIKVLNALQIPYRQKDIQAWQDGNWNERMRSQGSILNPVVKPAPISAKLVTHDMRLHELDRWPEGWTGTEKRWFPADESGTMPLQKWGYFPDYRPELYERSQAVAISPTGMVGQNVYAQPLVIIDIDGEGHGVRDQQVIDFGRMFSGITETWENPAKPDSFHLYFNTQHRIPIAHFPYAKLDLMGNQTNAAVYSKRKESNGLPRAELTEEIWEELKGYVRKRKEQRDMEKRGKEGDSYLLT